MSEAKIAKIADQLMELTLLEASDLSKLLESKGIVAAAPVAVAAAAVPGAAVEEKTEFDLVLAEAGAKKLDVIKKVREICPELTLPDAKTLVESAPKTLKSGISKDDAEKFKKSLEEAGAKIELK